MSAACPRRSSAVCRGPWSERTERLSADDLAREARTDGSRIAQLTAIGDRLSLLTPALSTVRQDGEALGRAAGEALRVMGAVTVLLIICGFIEGYVSPDPEVPRWARVTIGVGYWLFMISFLRGYVFGRSRGGPAINA